MAMGPVPQKTLNWLYNVLTGEYHDVNRTYTDVAQTLFQNPNLSPRTDVYTYENGRSALLLNLSGTLPVNFRGTTYMFPISIWVPHEYPRAVPINLVVPTKSMAVRPGQYVSGEGRVYHPYLAGWREDRSTILEFLSIMQEVFAREPPVFSRPEFISQLAPSSNPNVAPPPVPPLPPELGKPNARNVQFQNPLGSESRPPPPPPKPFVSWPQAHITSVNGAPPVPPHPGKVAKDYGQIQKESQKDYIALDLPQRTSSLQIEKSPGPSNHHPIHRQNQELRQDSYSPVSPLTPPRQLADSASSSRQPQRPYSVQGLPPPRLPESVIGQSNIQYHQDTHSPPYQKLNYPLYPPNPISLNHPLQQPQPHPQQQQPPKPKLTEDLLTSPFETPLPAITTNIAPPPIPPNPEKDALLAALSQTLTQQIHSTHAANVTAIPPLQAQQAALHATLAAFNREIAQLNNLDPLLASNEEILHQAMRDADKVMEDAKHRDVPAVDDVLVAPTVVAGQLYELVADERSLEECRRVVGKALDRGRIGGDIWAKQTRSLAREEFLKKALIRKVARGMGLVEEERWD